MSRPMGRGDQTQPGLLPGAAGRWGYAVLACVAGGVAALGLAPFQLLWALPLGLAVVAWAFLQQGRPFEAARLGWLFGCGYFGLGLSWILEPFQVDAASYGWMAPFALLFMAAGLALFWGLAFWVAAWLCWRPVVKPVPTLLPGEGEGAGPLGGALLCLAAFWTLAELARAYVLTGFPWAGFAQALPVGLVLPWLPWLGAHGVGFVILLTVLPLALVLRRQVVAGVLPFGLGALALAGGAMWVPPVSDLEMTGDVVRLVQPNAPQDEKWHPEKRWDFFRAQLEMSAAIGDVDLIVWPETAVPSLQNYADRFAPAMERAAQGRPLLYGIQREEAGAYYNSAVRMGGARPGLDIYDKMHLVPFGEYMPLPELAARFGVFGLAARANAGYAPGAERALMDLAVGRALVLICYEGVFAQDVNAAPERPDLLVLITNDAWFGTSSGPQQHLLQAQFRAAEQGLPMVRVANTGISAMIDPYGRILSAIPLGLRGFEDAALPRPLGLTLYARVGDWPVLVLVLAGLSAAACAFGGGRRVSRNCDAFIRN